jgi:hypothetical protein
MCAPSWFYLQDYTRMYGQQKIKKNLFAMLQEPKQYLTARRFQNRAAALVVDSRNAPPFTTSKET